MCFQHFSTKDSSSWDSSSSGFIALVSVGIDVDVDIDIDIEIDSALDPNFPSRYWVLSSE